MIDLYPFSTTSPLAAIRAITFLLVMTAAASLTAIYSNPVRADILPAPQIVREHSDLLLNGFATRQFFRSVDVYVGSLYVEHKSQDAQALMKADEHRVMQFDMLRDVRGRRIANAFYEGMQLNVSPKKIDELKQQINLLLPMFNQKLNAGDTAIVEYIPTKGTRVVLAGQEKGVIPGKALFDAILSIWLGEYPVSDTFKEGILGLES